MSIVFAFHVDRFLNLYTNQSIDESIDRFYSRLLQQLVQQLIKFFNYPPTTKFFKAHDKLYKFRPGGAFKMVREFITKVQVYKLFTSAELF